MKEVMVTGELDRTFAWDGARLCDERDLLAADLQPETLRGAVATALADPGGERWRIVRDPLGLNKLFWGQAADGGVDLACRPWRLLEADRGLDQIAAVPRGSMLDLEPGGGRGPVVRFVPAQWATAAEADALELEHAATTIRELLDRYLAAIAARHAAAPVFVCLSGGVDSTGIAALVAEHFPGAVAVSFDLAGRGAAASEDRRAGVRVAADLGLSLLEVDVTERELLEPLDTVLREGIDWRDFNVHAGLVNAALAAAIAEAAKGVGERPLVFTGDLANEFLIDYEPESYRGQAYYALPRLAPARLRSFLVRGLDSCHREVGIFGAWQLALIQPYAVAVDAYMRLPEALLRLPERKQILARAIFGDRVPEYVLARPKARAQVGGVDQAGGVLAACIDHGVDAAALRARFAELHGVSDQRALDRFIRAGRYRAGMPSALEVAG